MPPSLTLAVISNQYLVCLGLQGVLERSATIRIVMRRYRRITPDLLLAEKRPDGFVLDLETNGDVIDTIRQIRESAPTSKIVLLSGVEDGQRMREAFACGVDGVILTVQPPEVVLAMIETLHTSVPRQAQIDDGGSVGVDLKIPPKQNVGSAVRPPAWGDALTEREQEVIGLVQRGLSNKEIAYQLSISDSTVRHHLTNIFDKVGVRNRQKLLVHTYRSCSIHA
jgi:Response regulator containing a CheY-like receiver domain and an HTH DNA-binding domain